MICHAQHSMLNHIYTLWFSIVILFGIHLIVGLLRDGDQVQTLSNDWKLQRQNKSLTDSAVYLRSGMWQRREAAGNCKICFERKHFESLLVYCCFHLSDFFFLCITKRPADCRYCLRGLYLSFPHCFVGFQSTSDFGPELSLANLSILLITTEWWNTQLWSSLRGQVPFPK